MPVPLMDIRGQYAHLLDDVKRAACDVIDSGRFILGPNVRALEEEIADALGARQAVAVANGTDAIVLALEALMVGPGDEVICPSHTFYATAEAVCRTGATPVFADIDLATFNLDPAAAEAAVTEKTRAIIAVHLCGQPADLPALREIADRHGLALVEDAAQAYGARYDRRPIGTFGDAATLSFFPSKNLPAMGDGGMVLVRDRDVADRVRMLRFHGSRDKRVFEHVGMNSRLDEMQAAIMRVLLPHVQGWNEARRAAAARYADLGLGELVELPREAPCTSHVYHLYVVRTTERDALAARLRDAGIGAVPYYSMPLHLQPVFASLGYKPGDLPNTERAARESLALPMFPTLDEASQREVVAAVRAAAPAAA
jgi:dTDP-4-amino-4,6-dideoxygalactose transaminase